MRRIFTLIAACVAFTSHAQVPYTTLDSLSAEIRKMQLSANGQAVNVNGSSCTLAFSDDNFGVLVHNRKAYSGMSCTANGTDRLEIIEHIDLGKTTGIELIRGNGPDMVKVNMPPGNLQALVFNDGEQKPSEYRDYVMFYTSTGGDRLHALLGALINAMKVEQGSVSESAVNGLSSDWAKAEAAGYPGGINAYRDFISKYPSSIYTAQAKQKLQELTLRKEQEDRRKAEASVLKDRVYSLAKIGDRSYTEYQYYNSADSLARIVINEYTEDEVGSSAYSNLISFRKEVAERYKWNKEYYAQKDALAEYDRLDAIANKAFERYSRKLDHFVNPSTYLMVGMLVLGGMAAATGAILTLTDEPTAGNDNLMIYGGTSFAIGLGWTIAKSASLKSVERKMNATRAEADALKNRIGAIVDKRNENYNGRPLIRK